MDLMKGLSDTLQNSTSQYTDSLEGICKELFTEF